MPPLQPRSPLTRCCAHRPCLAIETALYVIHPDICLLWRGRLYFGALCLADRIPSYAEGQCPASTLKGSDLH